MATPKGTRHKRLPVNDRDSVHVYCDERRIWLQLRRKVPTERAIGDPSFKAALCLTPGTARKLGTELFKVAQRNEAKLKARNLAAAQQLAAKAGPEPAGKVKQPGAEKSKQGAADMGKQLAAGTLNQSTPAGGKPVALDPSKQALAGKGKQGAAARVANG